MTGGGGARDSRDGIDWLGADRATAMTPGSAGDVPGDGGAGAQPSEPPIVLGRYQIERVLGTGGVGFVAQARDMATGERVAIKFLRPEKRHRRRLVERLLREARNVALLKSEHVCRVYDAGTLDHGSSYIIMEFLSGVDLRAVVRLRGRPDPRTAVDWVLQACAGVAEAHELGIVHRDIKPSNLFLTRTPDGREIVKVIDFGMSTSAGRDPSLTMSREVLGTPAYMAPEQLRSVRTVDARADVWSLGVVLYELLTGSRLFAARGLRKLLVAIASAPIPPLGQDVPPELAAVVRRCLERDVDRRLPDARSLADALAACPPWVSAGGDAGDDAEDGSGELPDEPRPRVAHESGPFCL